MSSPRHDGPDGVPALEDVDDLKADLARAFAVAGVGIEAVATAVAT